ncbi:hypothetical protein ACH35V_40565 [Actinomadura sp. 1N219]|uniref:hypothetical protein n=1 Tax=Actinomadura sp. 1N219 TaxID=3375152 RepID=UPI0037BD8E9F
MRLDAWQVVFDVCGADAAIAGLLPDGMGVPRDRDGSELALADVAGTLWGLRRQSGAGEHRALQAVLATCGTRSTTPNGGGGIGAAPSGIGSA